ncbi:MAG: DUF5914 domain-containing protein [Mobilicoccus sp.]|nr:DUF5914 domain-containing protein [Mobilicoccus sp.]
MSIPVRRLPQPEEARLRSTWRAASVPRINAALADAQHRPTGGWHVVGASTDVRRPRDGRTPATIVRVIAGREIVLFRDEDDTFHAGPGACPHMGARLEGCVVADGSVLCRWHGLALGGARSEMPFEEYVVHDDGVLLWVRLDDDPLAGELTWAPTLTARPDPGASIAAVVAEPGECEPEDVIANRLDPWHGAWFHPYAFSHLEVDEDASEIDRLVVDVTFRLGRTFGVPVRAEFACPDARTIVMTILDGEGTGSVVETHATPLTAPGAPRARTMVTEATIATSPRQGFRVARALTPLVAAGIRHTARGLWVDDLAYAERRYALRQNGSR